MPLLSDNLAQALFEALPDPVLVCDGDGCIIGSNPAAVEMTGYSVEELHGRMLSDIEVSEEAAGPDIGSRMRLRRKDGTMVVAERTIREVEAGGKGDRRIVMLRASEEIRQPPAAPVRTEAVIRSAIESMSEGFVIYDEQDRLVLCNDAYRKMYAGCGPAMLEGQTFEAILRCGITNGYYPEAGETEALREAFIKRRLERHLNPGEPFFDHVSGDRWIQIDERVTADNYRVGLRTDVTALRQMKTEVERLGNIIENVAQEVYVTSLKTFKFVSVNRSARENLQYSFEELRELSPVDINREDFTPEIRRALADIDVGAVNTVLSFDTWHHRKDGSKYPCRVKLERIDEIPDPVVIAFVEDTTERLEYDRELERRQREFETLVQSLPDIITRARPDTTLIYVNDNYMNFTGLTADEMIGRRFTEFILPKRRAEVLSAIAKLSPQEPMCTIEQEMRDHSGRQFWYSWTNLMVFEGRTPVELVSVGRDVTEAHQARERIARQSQELARRNDALEQFAGLVSHDLKAPLRQIRMFVDLIAEDVANGKTDAIGEYARLVSERGQALERMISSLLNYSQLAYRSIKPERFRLSDAIATAWDNLAVTAHEAGARLEVESDAEAHADLHLLIHLFQNLFANAIKYQAEGTSTLVRVRLSVSGGLIRIVVEDNGIGIDPDKAEHIFGLFQRLHHDEQKYTGTGLGLALCRRIAESHGGCIRLDPDYTGGARFVIVLPERAAG